MEVQAFSLLCALAMATFLSGISRPRQILCFLAGAGIGITLLAPSLVRLSWGPLIGSEPAQIALLLFMFAFARILNLMRAYFLLALAGVLAVIWLQTLATLGYPPLFAALVVVGTSFAALFGSLHRPGFRTAYLLDEALLIVISYALALAIIPAAVTGWNAAVGLKSQAFTGNSIADDGGAVLWLAAGFAVLGAACAGWKRVEIVSRKKI